MQVTYPWIQNRPLPCTSHSTKFVFEDSNIHSKVLDELSSIVAYRPSISGTKRVSIISIDGSE